MFLCFAVQKEKRRLKYILPFCFLLLTFFFSIRYDYGLDYHNYLDAFVSGKASARGAGDQEVDAFFYTFLHFFGKFYIFIIVHTIIVFSALYYLTKKYCDNRYYILFFFLLLTQNGLIFNMISALRSTLAAVVLWLALDFFYINKKRWIPYVLLVVFASLFHTSVILFLFLPLVDFLVLKIKPRTLFFIIAASSIIPMFFANTIIDTAVSNVDAFQIYEDYTQSDFTSNLTGVLIRALWLFPTFFIIKHSEEFKNKNQGLYVISILFITIYIINMDWQDRFSTYLKIFWVFAFSIIAPKLNPSQKIIALVPLVTAVLFSFYQFVTSMYIEYMFSEGNYLYFHTIFEVPRLP